MSHSATCLLLCVTFSRRRRAAASKRRATASCQSAVILPNSGVGVFLHEVGIPEFNTLCGDESFQEVVGPNMDLTQRRFVYKDPNSKEAEKGPKSYLWERRPTFEQIPIICLGEASTRKLESRSSQGQIPHLAWQPDTCRVLLGAWGGGPMQVQEKPPGLMQCPLRFGASL